MGSFKQHMIFSLLIFFIYYDESTAADSPCGDWEPYKDEKCFKVLDKYGTEEVAENTCKQQENSANLVTIHSKDEQDFLTNLLFKTHKVVDAVWIGVKYSSNKFKWIDDSDLSFTYWVDASPSNTTDKACVQIIAEGSSMGKWANEPCNKNNKVVCQKMQTWSLSRLQKTLLDAKKKFEDSLEDIRKNQVPIGFIYVQLPNEKSPTEIWSWMTWNDVSSTYAGVFFRVSGGEAASFGQVQDEYIPRITSTHFNTTWSKESKCKSSIDLTKSGSDCIQTGYFKAQDGTYIDATSGLTINVSSGEVRPRNMAIRVWKRTG